MRFVPTKTVEQQSGLMLHRARHLFIRQQTAVINSIRAYLAEFGIVAPVGRRGVEQLLEVVANTADHRLPEVARACLAALGSQLRALKAQILEFDRRIMAWHRSNATSKRLDAIPGVGPALATALVTSIADPGAFRSARVSFIEHHNDHPKPFQWTKSADDILKSIERFCAYNSPANA